jgi:ADP-heptose:LPS heptosyltransferase
LPRPILIDKGAGGEEAERVERAVSKAGGEGIVMWDGSFAGFAAHIQRSRLYVGYDSAGGHAAAACRIPMISIFTGAVSERMFQRWRPTGHGKIEILRPEKTGLSDLLATFEASLRRVSLSSDPREAGPASQT